MDNSSKTTPIRVLVKKLGEKAEVQTIDYCCTDTSAIRNIIGGFLEVVKISEDIFVAVDDVGKIKGYVPNLYFGMHDVLVGTVVFIGETRDNEYGESYFCSLSDAQLMYAQYFCRHMVIDG